MAPQRGIHFSVPLCPQRSGKVKMEIATKAKFNKFTTNTKIMMKAAADELL